MYKYYFQNSKLQYVNKRNLILFAALIKNNQNHDIRIFQTIFIPFIYDFFNTFIWSNCMFFDKKKSICKFTNV